MVVILPQASFATTLQQCTDLGIQLYFDETSYQSMFTALRETIAAKGNRLAELRESCRVPIPSGSGNSPASLSLAE